MELLYWPLPSAEDPASGYRGFDPHTEILPAGYQAQEGRLPFACDTLLQQDLACTVRDGTTLYMDIYRPVGAEKVPAIVAWGPWGKRGRNLASGFTNDWKPKNTGLPEVCQVSGLQANNGQDPAIWVQYGYAIVNVDPRGVYASEGDMRYFGLQDSRDAYDVIEFLAAQDWCTGKIGLSGNHWYGLEQWFIAAQQPPHLYAMAPADAHGNLYREEFCRGGIPRMDYTARERSYTTHGGRCEDICGMLEQHPLFDEYWAEKAARVEDIHIPCYVTASWTQTNHSRGPFENFERLGTDKKWLRVHNGGEFTEFRAPETVADVRRFFDRYLKDEENGWEDTPRVRLTTLDPGGDTVEGRPMPDFPLPNEKAVSLYLSADGRLHDAPVEDAASVSYTADDDKSVCCFTYPFDRETEITGYAALRLYLAAECADADVFVRLFKLDAQGNKLWTSTGNLYSGTNGRLRASHRALNAEKSTALRPWHDHTAEAPLTPGEIVRLDIDLWPMSMVFHPGQQLMVEVSGWEIKVAHFSMTEMIPTRNRGSHTLWCGGAYDACLTVPVIEG